jgi:DNA-binding SARP family transcriptional activator
VKRLLSPGHTRGPATYVAEGGLVRFGILGPVEIHRDGARPRLRAGRERSLLGLLLLYSGHTFTLERVIDLLWEDPPSSARAQVYNLVSRLRQHLRDPRGTLLVTADGGYRLVPGPHVLDLLEFRAASADGRRAAGEAAWDQAAEQFTAALGCWRGTALGGCPEPFAATARQDLEREHRSAREGLADAQLGLGRHDQALATLGTLLAEDPYREDLYQRRMLALSAQGRTAEALATYQEAYRRLGRDLGVGPGVQLRQLHDAVLKGTVQTPRGGGTTHTCGTPRSPAPASPRPEPSPASGPHAPSRERTPRQLPPATATLWGRDRLPARVRRALLRGGGTAAVVVLSGQGGAGKTEIALHTGHSVAEEFPDGQLYADLRGSGPQPADPHHITARLLRGLSADGPTIPADPDERAAELRSRLAGRRTLLLLDDVRDEAQLRPLLPGTADCAVLVTSRRQLAALSDATAVEVNTLHPEDSFALLADAVGGTRIHAEPCAARDVARLCGHLPLALRAAGARLAARNDLTVGRFRDRLSRRHARLDQLTVGDLDVRASIARSYRELPPVPQRALRRLGMLAGRSVPGWVVGALAGPDLAGDDRLPDQLVERRLLHSAGTDRAGQSRFRLHELTHDFAFERAMTEDPAPERDAAVERVLRHWLLLASAAGPAPGGVLDLVRPVGDGPFREALLAASEHSADWFAAERANLGSAVRLARQLGLAGLAGDLAAHLDGPLVLRGHGAARQPPARAVLDA